MQMGRIKPLKEVSNPVDFKKQFLHNPEHSFCETCHSVHAPGQCSFLEIAPLELLKSLHKQPSFESVRRKFYTLVLVTAGSLTETIGYNTYTFGAGTLYFIPENQLHAIHGWSNDIKGYHCIFDADYFLLCLKNQVQLQQFPFMQPGKDPFLQLTAAESSAMKELLQKLSFEYCGRKTFNDDLLVRLYLNVLLIEAERIYQTQNPPPGRQQPRKEQLVARFRNLVAKHCIQYRQVANYARLLYVNPHYLNDTVKELTGRPASSFIYHQLLSEAKACLVQTDDTVANIAANLNFTDVTYFSRFFKKHAGVTPKQYRNGHHH
jgi:AraC-like DNA-binding protein